MLKVPEIKDYANLYANGLPSQYVFADLIFVKYY